MVEPEVGEELRKQIMKLAVEVGKNDVYKPQHLNPLAILYFIFRHSWDAIF